MSTRFSPRPLGAAAALLATAALTACGAPQGTSNDPLAGVELTEPRFAEADAPELLGGPEDVQVADAGPSSPSVGRGFDRDDAAGPPPPPPVGNYVLTVPDRAEPVGPGGPVQPQPYGLAASAPSPAATPAPAPEPARVYASADVIGAPAMPKSYGRTRPPARSVPLAGGPEVTPMAPRQYASADVAGLPAGPRPYSALGPRTMTDTPPAPAPSGSQPAPSQAAAPIVVAAGPIPNDGSVATPYAATPYTAASGLPQARANTQSGVDAITGPSANAPVLEAAPAPTAAVVASVPAPAVAPQPVAAVVASPVPRPRTVTPTPRSAPASRADAAPAARATTAVPAASSPITTSTDTAVAPATASPAQRVAARVWWALGLLALGLLAIVVVLGRGGRERRTTASV